MRTLTIEIPGRPPTPNARRHWRAIQKDNEKWSTLARLSAIAAAEKAGWILMQNGTERIRIRPRHLEERPKMIAVEPIAWAHRYVMCLVVSSQRERDWDNAVASGKPLTDGLVSAGVLAGDSTKYIDSTHRQVYFRHEPGVDAVRIYIEEGEKPLVQLGLLHE